MMKRIRMAEDYSTGFQLDGHDVGEYTLATSQTADALVEAVNGLIRKKWFPIGGPVVVNTTEGPGFIQALVRSKLGQGKRISKV
jgi:hypothetical protein